MNEGLSVKTLSAPWLVRLNWDELISLLVCVSLDLLEFVFPPLLVPLVGDILDFAGIVFCVYFFNWVGLVALFELLPGLDILPNFTITWLVWYILKRRSSQSRMEEELERWR